MLKYKLANSQPRLNSKGELHLVTESPNSLTKPPPSPPNNPLVRVGPQLPTSVAVLALSTVRTLASTIAPQIARVDSIAVGRLVHVGPYIVVVVVIVIGRVAIILRAVGMRLVVWPSIVPRHERLVPDGVAAVLDILPLAPSTVSQSPLRTPAETKLSRKDLVEFSLEPNSPGLRDRKARGNLLVAVITVEAVAHLIPGLVPESPGILIKPLLRLMGANGRQRLSLVQVDDLFTRLILNTRDVVGNADLFKLLASVLVLHNLRRSIRMADLGDDISTGLFDKSTARVRVVSSTRDKGCIGWRWAISHNQRAGQASCRKRK